MRTTLAVTAVVVASWAAVAGLPARAGQRTFRSGVDMVTLRRHRRRQEGATSSPTSRKGTSRSTRTGRSRPCGSSSRATRSRAATPGRAATVDLHLGALLDISGSMDENMQFARSAAIKFLGSRPEARDFTLVEFDTEVRVSRYSQSEFGRLVERIRSRQAEGDTALWDATGVYLDGASRQEGRKVLVLYTDGGDNASSLPFNDLIDLLKASDVTVHAIGFVEHQPVAAVARAAHAAAAHRGSHRRPGVLPGVDARPRRGPTRQVAAEIDAQYSIGYVSTNTKTDGTWRKVEIRVTRPGLEGVKVRTRPGYFALRKPSARVPGE